VPASPPRLATPSLYGTTGSGVLRAAHLDPLLPDGRNPLRSVLVGDKHYIAWEDGREERYDLATDPGEQHDLSDSLKTDLPELRQILATFP